MKLKLTPAEMLDRWRLHAACSPPLTDASFRRTDGIDTDAIFTADMEHWYHRLLLEAPPSQLAPAELAAETLMPSTPDSGGATVLTLPAGVVRVLEVSLSSWLRPAVIVTDPDCALLARQLHPYTRATAACPVAFFTTGRLRLYPPAAPADRLETLSCVIHTPGIYEFDSSALSALHPGWD